MNASSRALPASRRSGDHLNRAILVAAIAMLFLLADGCGLTAAQRAKNCATQFIAALDHHDNDAARALITEAAKDKLSDPANFTAHMFDHNSQTSSDNSTPTTVGDPVISQDGLTARVPYTKADTNGHTTTGAVLERNTDAGWRVSGITVRVGDGMPELTIDFEHPDAIFGEVGRLIGAGIGAATRNLTTQMNAFAAGMAQGMARSSQAPTPPAPPAP